MRGDIPQAAFRLLASLPVRTHLTPEIPVYKMPKRRRVDGSVWNAKRKVCVKGRVFDSMKLARKTLHMGEERLMKMLASGEAQYVE